MRATTIVAIAALTGAVLAGGALPAGAEPLSLPILALAPEPTPSIWSGLYVGTEVFAIGGRRGVKGGFGGAADIGYNHEFANNVVLGIEGSAGYTPFHFTGGRAHGYDFASTSVKVGYDMGRLMPFVTGSVALLKPDLGSGLGGLNAGNSFNNLMNGSGTLKAAGSVGAGVDYALTNNLTVGVAVSVTQNPGAFPY